MQAKNPKAAFTLVELMVSLSVATLCAALSMGAWYQFRQHSLVREKRWQNELRRETLALAYLRKATRGHEAGVLRCDLESGRWEGVVLPKGWQAKCGQDGLLMTWTICDSLGACSEWVRRRH